MQRNFINDKAMSVVASLTYDQVMSQVMQLPRQQKIRLSEELEEMEDIRLYDEAKKNDDGEYILFSDYLKNRCLSYPRRKLSYHL